MGSPAATRMDDDVDAGDEFGDGVLDLDAGVDLEHVEVLPLVHEELDGGGRSTRRL